MREQVSIEKYVADLMDVDVSLLFTDCRFRKVADARKICFKFIRDYTGVLPKTIGEYFNHDRTTVNAGIKACDNLCLVDKKFREKYNKVYEAYHIENKICLPFDNGRMEEEYLIDLQS